MQPAQVFSGNATTFLIRLLTLTGARLSEILNLKWDEIGELSGDGTSARIADSKTGPRTIWLGPEAAGLLAALHRPQGRDGVFPEDLTSQRLYAFWVVVREEAGLPGLRIHDCRHTWASQGVMNGVGLTTVGRLLGHRDCETTAIYAHLDDAALRDAAAQAAVVIAGAMNYKGQPPPLPEEAEEKDAPTNPPEFMKRSRPLSPDGPRTSLGLRSGSHGPGGGSNEPGCNLTSGGDGETRKTWSPLLWM